ncbi:RING-H2 FINGER PROTEIN ATL51-LIKE [Salix purpurea]|uniref:RING-H2 FINGER PROTEIN ATL51-LIKE n=1 Tax=Salix purpurea TaxID=77065 RepID=A0A9Q0TTB9_SALPP|nr:RING-H2 FINGER PROTEIN ATL51-LIKE [Salix purpurea]
MIDLGPSVFILILFLAVVFSLALAPVCVHWHREKDQNLRDLERGEVNQSPQLEEQHHHDLERVEETRRRQLATISLLILHLTHHVPSNDERIVTSRNDGCVICLEDFRLGEDCQAMSMCKHVFHSGCLEEWLVQNQSCPLCRIDLSFSSHLSCSIHHYLGAQHESFM